jgi:hypothetical protein
MKSVICYENYHRYNTVAASGAAAAANYQMDQLTAANHRIDQPDAANHQIDFIIIMMIMIGWISARAAQCRAPGSA